MSQLTTCAVCGASFLASPGNAMRRRHTCSRNCARIYHLRITGMASGGKLEAVRVAGETIGSLSPGDGHLDAFDSDGAFVGSFDDRNRAIVALRELRDARFTRVGALR